MSTDIPSVESMGAGCPEVAWRVVGERGAQSLTLVSGARRIQLSRAKGWRKPAGAVVVTRPGRWGNPFRTLGGLTSAQAVQMYRELIATGVARSPRTGARFTGEDYYAHPPGGRKPMIRPTQDDIKRALAGRPLACWCPTSQPCHADVLLAIANT